VSQQVIIAGGVPLRGRVRVPGDKSMSHRALLFAALAEGTSRVRHLSPGEDVARTGALVDALGARVRDMPGADGERAASVASPGVDGLREPDAVVDCGNSGTTMRLGLGLLAGRPFHAVLTGDDSLVRRPMARVAEPLRTMGARVDGRDGGNFAPLAVRGGSLHSVRYELPVASAQVKSSLVLAGLQADGTTEIVEPAPTRDHTERMLGALGVALDRPDERTLRVHAGEPRPFELDVPGDPSSAAFFVVAACLTPGSDVVVEEVCLNPTRVAFVEVLARMGADVAARVTGERAGEPVGEIHARTSELRGAVVAGDEVPSLIVENPVLAVAAAFADGVTEFHDARELRVKESDRIATVQQELSQLGVAVEPRPDGMLVRGGRPRAATLKSHGDHRVAMAGAVAAIAIEGESTVRGWNAVAVSYPAFADDLVALGGSVA
jgi:3-phosphoshikimate 1-carboxyvinyltransferase